MSYSQIKVPENGKKITVENGKLNIPDEPIIPFIEGDGIGSDITKAMITVVDAAVSKAFGGKQKIHWMEVYAGDKANQLYGEWLPKETLTALEEFVVSIKGPLTTPIGGGFRSINVTLRQMLDLYICLRPCRWYGSPSPVLRPQDMDIIVFRENTEDVYAGIEWKAESDDAKKVIEFLNNTMKTQIRKESGIGIKPVSNLPAKD